MQHPFLSLFLERLPHFDKRFVLFIVFDVDVGDEMRFLGLQARFFAQAVEFDQEGIPLLWKQAMHDLAHG
ncbi:MAG: hypothetical protein ACK5MA_05060 [Parachlamydiaceae bacterium]